ncbi:D-alanyl-D-alanine dipeptidase [compost metagenome]
MSMKKIIFLTLFSSLSLAKSPKFPLVDVAQIIPSAVYEIRYAGDHNFVGRPIEGYKAEKCFLAPQAAQALKKVQEELSKFSMSLKIYDCYRPQRAVNDFVRWAKDVSDNKMKKEFYPQVDKTKLFAQGYIASKSGHSRGSTVDLTIVSLPVSEQPEYRDGQKLTECFTAQRFADNSLDMGTGYDCFDVLSHTENSKITAAQKTNRLLLKTLMEKHGFRNLPEEWWHFTLNNEPYPKTYFDIPIE